jgi:uncharacterized protein YyaL (SSP411 family)
MNPKINRLARENSPYLRQHSTNPVDWYPWSEEAFEQATRKNLPVFLSIGYSTCHWCHVRYRELARTTLSAFGGMLQRSPPAYSYMLTGLMLEAEATLVVIVTDSEKIGLKEMMGVVRKNNLLQTILLLKNPKSARDLARIAPYTFDMDVKEGRTTAYVCKGQSCAPPVNDPRELESLLF